MASVLVNARTHGDAAYRWYAVSSRRIMHRKKIPGFSTDSETWYRKHPSSARDVVVRSWTSPRILHEESGRIAKIGGYDSGGIP
jgi:hypothetical protein